MVSVISSQNLWHTAVIIEYPLFDIVLYPSPVAPLPQDLEGHVYTLVVRVVSTTTSCLSVVFVRGPPENLRSESVDGEAGQMRPDNSYRCQQDGGQFQLRGKLAQSRFFLLLLDEGTFADRLLGGVGGVTSLMVLVTASTAPLVVTGVLKVRVSKLDVANCGILMASFFSRFCIVPYFLLTF